MWGADGDPRHSGDRSSYTEEPFFGVEGVVRSKNLSLPKAHTVISIVASLTQDCTQKTVQVSIDLAQWWQICTRKCFTTVKDKNMAIVKFNIVEYHRKNAE